VVVHFFVASKVAKYRAFNRAVSLGNTLLYRLSFR
jgi:CRISPR/Cas system-associated endonuclease Cas1